MKRILSLAALCMLFAGASQATPIFFTISGALACGANATCAAGPANTLTFASTLAGGPSLTVAYVGGGDTAEVPPLASANFGSIVLACAGCTNSNNAAWNLAGASAVVTFVQTLPVADTGDIGGTFSSASLGWSGPSGVSGGQTGFALFTWSSTDAALSSGGSAPVTYEIFTPVVLLQLGNNSVQGLVNVPEPSSLALLGLGLLALRRRIAR